MSASPSSTREPPSSRGERREISSATPSSASPERGGSSSPAGRAVFSAVHEPGSGPPSSRRFDNGLRTVELLGMKLAACSEAQLLEAMFAASNAQRGGWLITANLDFLRRFYKEERMQVLYGEADLRVADGMPLVWAAWLQGTPVPERIAGSSLIRPLARRAAAEGRRVYFLGGEGRTAEDAAALLKLEFPGLPVAGFSSPWLPAEPDEAAVEPTRQILTEARPDIVLVALGSPKQEWLISKLRRSLPACWFIGVGMSFSFTTGHRARAPLWMQRSGLEWVHRLISEPRRLGKRYLWDGAPFGLELLGRSLWKRFEAARAAGEVGEVASESHARSVR